MEKNRGALKWTLIIMMAAVIFIAVGYYASVLFKEQPDSDKVLAEAVMDENGFETEVTESQIQFTQHENEEKAKVTTGRRSYAIQVAPESVNVLILGQDKVSNLYDTIGIASIDKANKHITLFMIPRDTYIEYGPQVMDVLKEKGRSELAGIYKINNTHNIGKLFKYEGRFESGSISFLADVVEEKFGVAVDDYTKVNTKGFAEFVDLFDGIDLNVPYNMDYEDPMQDLYIHLKKGQQHMNGEDAEGFVRFRQGYKEDGSFFQVGDIERKEHQVYFIKEFINQHGTLKNIDKLPKLLDLLGKNLNTSINPGEILTKYMGIAREVISDKYEIDSVILDGDQFRINGSAYLDIE